jgi:undecaprenyl-diphosphatase
MVFVTSAAVVGRERPDVEQLDDSPPTSSYPSGHTGASTAFYLVLAILAQRITRPALRWAATATCLLVPVLVAFARLYRGMHQPTDVALGVVNGVVCAWLAWRYLRRSDDAVPPGRREAEPTSTSSEAHVPAAPDGGVTPGRTSPA